MKVYESLDNIEKFESPVLTIGNYDGIHIGHKRIIERVKAVSASISGTPMLMTFNPHPLTLLRPDMDMHFITPLDVKIKLVEDAGIEVMFIIPFTEEFRQVEPEEFVKVYLVEKIGISWLIIGHDFKFGRNGKGDVASLKRFSKTYGFSFEIVEAVMIDGERVGSNRIRKYIMEGDLEKAERFLGRPYMIKGIVQKGYGVGRMLGFPTINLETGFKLLPPPGVYITEVRVAERMYPSVTNIGYRPTFDKQVNRQALSIETHIIDYEGDLYGMQVAIYFHKRIRDEKRFSNPEELKEAIKRDIEIARRAFNLALPQ